MTNKRPTRIPLGPGYEEIVCLIVMHCLLCVVGCGLIVVYWGRGVQKHVNEFRISYNIGPTSVENRFQIDDKLVLGRPGTSLGNGWRKGRPVTQRAIRPVFQNQFTLQKCHPTGYILKNLMKEMVPQSKFSVKIVTGPAKNAFWEWF